MYEHMFFDVLIDSLPVKGEFTMEPDPYTGASASATLETVIINKVMLDISYFSTQAIISMEKQAEAAYISWKQEESES